MTKAIPVITLDGPSGAGKGTVGIYLAAELGWNFLDSGAVYRTLAFAAEQQGVSLQDEAALATLASQLKLKFEVVSEEKKIKVFWDDRDITRAIRTEGCADRASLVAHLPLVRQALLKCQRSFRQLPGLVADGRDMGSTIFPDALLKVCLDASLQERARRRQLQLNAQGIDVSLAGLCEELGKRDRRDRERTISPLISIPDAVTIDTTHLKLEEVLRCVREHLLKAQSGFSTSS